MAHRIERVNHIIRQQIRELLQRQVKDPRLGSFVSINEVVTSPDLQHAKVFVSCIDSSEKKKEILGALVAASGFLHNELSKRLKLRYIPELEFYWDDSIEQGARILALIERVTEIEGND
jgi:ribosome-binding factor A